MDNKNILVVDDEKELTSTLEYFFTKEGRSVSVALSGDEAIRKLGLGSIDLVILDMKMKGLDGPAVLKIINEKYPNTKVVILTGYGEQYEERVKNLKFEAFLTKPFSPKEVIETAKDILEGKTITKEVIPLYNDPYIMPKAKLLFIDVDGYLFGPKAMYFEDKDKCGGEYKVHLLFIGPEIFETPRTQEVKNRIRLELEYHKPDIVLGNAIVLGAPSAIYETIANSSYKPKDIIVYSNVEEEEKVNLPNLPPLVDIRLDKLGKITRETCIKYNLYTKIIQPVRIPALGLKDKIFPKPIEKEEPKKQITKEDIPNIARRIIAEQLGISEDEIYDNTHLARDLGMDSLDSIEITMDLEEELGFQISDTDAERLYKFKQVVDYLQKRLVQEKKK